MAAENVPDIVLRPPSDEHGTSISLFQAVVHPLPGGSEDLSPVALPKRRRRHVPPPSPTAADAPPPSGLTLWIPGWAHIPSILERLVISSPSPGSPVDRARAIFDEAYADILSCHGAQWWIKCSKSVRLVLKSVTRGCRLRRA